MSTFSSYDTPLGEITVDLEGLNLNTVVQSLRLTGAFKPIARDIDINEHSLELHLPFIKRVLPNATLVPIMVGQLSAPDQLLHASILAPFFNDPANLFIISTDFCHWGTRFGYTPHDGNVPIYEFIQALDRRAMTAIESANPAVFGEYLQHTKNTICGRNPVLVLLALLESNPHCVEFIHYAQSSKAKSFKDSSVSYAAAKIYKLT